MDWRSNKGKSKLIRELIAKGISVRKAEKGVNAVFDCMARAVRRGESVEIPGGRIQVKIRKGQPRREWQRFVNVRTGKIMFTIVDFRGKRLVVKFSPDLNLDLSPLPQPLTPDEIEALQLASELLGKTADFGDNEKAEGYRYCSSEQTRRLGPSPPRSQGQGPKYRHVTELASRYRGVVLAVIAGMR